MLQDFKDKDSKKIKSNQIEKILSKNILAIAQDFRDKISALYL